MLTRLGLAKNPAMVSLHNPKHTARCKAFGGLLVPRHRRLHESRTSSHASAVVAKLLPTPVQA